MGIASLVLGILSVIIAITLVFAPLGVILAVIGLILGIVDTVKKGKTGEKRVISIVGFVICASIFVVLIMESIIVISTGIIIVDTANDNTNEIVDTLTTMEIDVFNAKFTSYEGSQKSGISVRNLLSDIYNSNSNNTDHQVYVYFNGTKEDPYSLKSRIVAGQTYTVALYKDIDGYIYKANITSESTTTIDNY